MLEGVPQSSAQARIVGQARGVGKRGNGVGGVPPASGIEEAGVVVVEGEQGSGGGTGVGKSIGT